MRKLIVIIVIVAVLLSGCATLGSSSNDTYTQKNLQVVEKTIEQNVWDLFKIGFMGVVNAILLNNYFIHP